MQEQSTQQYSYTYIYKYIYICIFIAPQIDPLGGQIMHSPSLPTSIKRSLDCQNHPRAQGLQRAVSYLDTLAWNHRKGKNTLNHKHSKNDLKFAWEMNRTHWNKMNMLEAILLATSATSPSSKSQVTPRQGLSLVPVRGWLRDMTRLSPFGYASILGYQLGGHNFGQVPTWNHQNGSCKFWGTAWPIIMAEVPSHKAVGTCWNISSVHFVPAFSCHNTPFKLQRTCIRESRDEAANAPATWILDRKIILRT